jgi:hypothetical protein
MVALRQDFGDDHKHWKLPEYADDPAVLRQDLSRGAFFWNFNNDP